MNSIHTHIRAIRENEISFLEEMLYEAIFVPEGTKKPQKSIIKLPELACYYTNFGRSGDICLVAELNHKLVGAIWTRLFPDDLKGYGYINDQTPELSMAILKPCRQNGIGTTLLIKILAVLKEENYQQVSLSVDKLNYAFSLYKKHGFRVYTATEKSATLLKQLN